MRSPYHVDDLGAEPCLRDMLADPIVRALMARDRVSEDELVQVSLAARTRLLRGRAAVVMPFPGPVRSHPPRADDGAGTEHPPHGPRVARRGSGDGR